jgi:hypothetical protein
MAEDGRWTGRGVRLNSVIEMNRIYDAGRSFGYNRENKLGRAQASSASTSPPGHWRWPGVAARPGRLGGRGREPQMPRRITISATLLALTLLLAIANVGSAASPSSGREAAARRAAQHPSAAAAPGDVFAINDGFVTKTYNHFGNPAYGILTAETWGETGWIPDVDPEFVVPNNTQGVVRALKQSKVLRVAVRVELWGTDDTGDHLLASSGTVNSGTAASVQVKTPEVDVRTAPCLLWTQAFVSIRWSDNRLSSVSFDMPVGYYNLDAHC